MVSVTCRLTTGVTETAGGGGAPWAAATLHDAATLSAPTAAFQASELRPGIGGAPDCGGRCRFGMPPLRDSLHLCEAAIHEQFRSRDVAAVVACEKHHGLGDLLGPTEPAERNSGRNHLATLLACFRGSQQIAQSGRVDGARAHRVHANVTISQVRRPCPRERTHRGFGGAIRRYSMTTLCWRRW